MFYILMALLLAGIVAALRSRRARLRRLAAALGGHYSVQEKSVLLPDSATRCRFFNQGLHQFLHVLTLHDPGVFLRICEDRIRQSPLDKTAAQTCCVAAAELTTGTFTPFVLFPRVDAKAASVPLPPELNTRYCLQAPDGFTLPPEITGFLKAHQPCYLELTDTALIYVEFASFTVAQVQPLRWRVSQFIRILRHPANTPIPAPKPAPALSDEDLQAQVLLKLHHPQPVAGAAPAATRKWLYAGIFLLLCLGLLLASGWMLHFIAAK